MLEQFRTLYPRSVQAPFAIARIEELKQLQTVAVVPPVRPLAPPRTEAVVPPAAVPPATIAPCGGRATTV
jgi:hypothetical protein